MPSRKRFLARRQFLSALGVGAAVGLTSTEALAVATGSERGDAPWWLLAPLAVGDSVGLGWRIGALSAVQHGAAVLELIHGFRGQIARVHICAHLGEPRGVVHTQAFDLILMDGGDGDRRTDEKMGRVLKTLARRMQKNERELGIDRATVRSMLTHVERVERYGAEALV